MTRWTPVLLGDICSFNYGKALPEAHRKDGQTPVYGSNGIVGFHNAAITSGPTIVVGRKGSYGEVNMSNVPCWPIDTTFFIDESSTKQDLRWLAHCLPSLRLNTLNKSAAVPGLSRDDAYRQPVLMPPLGEQRRIADILDTADALRAKRRALLLNLDRLAQAIFLTVFGDPVSNPKQWANSVMLGDIADVASGITKGRKLGAAATRTVPYLAVANVQDKRLHLSNVKEIEATEAEIQRYRLQRDDLLLTEGGDPDKLGRGTLWREELPECIHQNHIFRVRVDAKDINPLYLNWLVASERGKRYFLRSAKQTTGIASINMTQLRGFPLLLPPMKLQKEFATRMADIEHMRALYTRALEMSDQLFFSLQHRAFRGELSLSKRGA